MLLRSSPTSRIMSKAWAEKNNVHKPQDFKNKEETFAARNANGTGPYMLVSRQPDVKTTLTVNPTGGTSTEGNVDEVVYHADQVSDADARGRAAVRASSTSCSTRRRRTSTRLRARRRAEVIDGTENRIIFIGMDQERDELLYSNVKGKNPFKDKRVRQALTRRSTSRRSQDAADARPVDAGRHR